MMARALPQIGLAVAVALAACSDPVHDNAVEKLGPEEHGVPAGPLHRPGQPCVAPCHGGSGPGGAVFVLGGTVYKAGDTLDPLPDAILRFIDSEGRRYETASNCAGNFFVDVHDYAPVWPLWVGIEFGGVVPPMTSPIFREGSCAKCHFDPAGPDSAGHVYFAPQPLDFPESACP
jgi:hypothetical protein